MIPYQDVRMDLMSSQKVHKYLKKNDLVILPVGCFEMHGPDIPLACDAFIDWAMAMLLAKEWKCLTLPPVYYTFPGASGPWPGTVDMPIKATQDYVAAIVRSLLKNGFKRIVLCGSHGPLGFLLECVTRDIFQTTGQVVVHLKPYYMIEAEMDKAGVPFGESGLVLGALKILGMHGAYDPASRVERPIEYPFKTIGKLGRLKTSVPWIFAKDYQHTGLRKQLKATDADKIVMAYEKTALALQDLPKHFAQYQKEMKQLYKLQPWKKENVWTKTK
jgi:hypothetical protein